MSYQHTATTVIRNLVFVVGYTTTIIKEINLVLRGFTRIKTAFAVAFIIDVIRETFELIDQDP